MGRLSHDPYIQHFSHPHQLELTNPQTVHITSPYCSGCKLQASGWMYTCRPCNFTLHLSCTQMPQLVNHPSHLGHPLSLLSTPSYPGGLFNCDGCGHQGQGFSYHCTRCDFDLHILCASKPLSLTHQSHACQLLLTFDPPYLTKGFSCDICHKFGSKHWLYRCSRCEFDAHLDCAATVITTQRPSPLAQPQNQSQVHVQHYNSFPGANQTQYVNTPGWMNQQVSMGAQQNNQVTTRPPYQTGNALMNAAVQGFVEGAAQQVGQNFAQGIMSDGNGGNNNCDPGNNGGTGFGSSILNGMLGDSGDTII